VLTDCHISQHTDLKHCMQHCLLIVVHHQSIMYYNAITNSIAAATATTTYTASTITAAVTTGVKMQVEKLMVDLRALATQASPPLQAQLGRGAMPQQQQQLQQQQGAMDSSQLQLQQQQPQQQLLQQQQAQAQAQAAAEALQAQRNKALLAARAAAAAAARNDPPGSREEVTNLLEYWIRICNERPGDEKAYAPYLQALQQRGALKTDEATERFFRVATELVVEACFKSARLSSKDTSAAVQEG
jgi:hypothetical protein